MTLQKLTDVSPIVGYGSPILRKTCEEVDDNELSRMEWSALAVTLDSLNSCVGLAAPQINIQARMFIMRPIKNLHTITVINPVITKRRGKQHYEEGCMSIPKTFGMVEGRDDIIDVEFYDEFFNKQKRRFRGFESIIFQHEYDHLNGILFIDHLTKAGREEISEKLNEIERGQADTTYHMFWPETDIKHTKD
ncbi:MAG: peptide deformylase [Bacteroidota bacterium]